MEHIARLLEKPTAQLVPFFGKPKLVKEYWLPQRTEEERPAYKKYTAYRLSAPPDAGGRTGRQLVINMKVNIQNEHCSNLKNNRFKMRHAAYSNR